MALRLILYIVFLRLSSLSDPMAPRSGAIVTNHRRQKAERGTSGAFCRLREFALLGSFLFPSNKNHLMTMVWIDLFQWFLHKIWKWV